MHNCNNFNFVNLKIKTEVLSLIRRDA
jgi:hypothetical protein